MIPSRDIDDSIKYWIMQSDSMKAYWTLLRENIYIKLRKKTFFLIGVYYMQGWTASTRHGVTLKL